MKNCCPDWNVPAFQQPRPPPPSAINGESADRTAPINAEDDLQQRVKREKDGQYEREDSFFLSPLEDLPLFQYGCETWTDSVHFCVYKQAPQTDVKMQQSLWKFKEK